MTKLPPNQCFQRKAVLIVEDEPLLLMEAADMVADAGYEPLEAMSAADALKILDERDDIVILFTDINLAGSVDGLELARVVSDRWPPIKVIVASVRHNLGGPLLPCDARFMPKPYMPADFNRLVADLTASA